MNAGTLACRCVPLLLALLLAACGEGPKGDAATPVAAKAALSVSLTTPQQEDWAQTLQAGGNIAAWQEAVIGAELPNYRITEVAVNVGDRVKKGQVLARIASETVESELAEFRAAVTEAEATLAEARANQERSRQLTERGFYSPQQNTQTRTAADTAQARLEAARARLQSAELRRAKATVLAPDAGIISARAATVGTMTQASQELFRLIRGGRLEWRAELTAAELARIKPGQVVVLQTPWGDAVEGVVRSVAPTVDAQTRIALVYVDLPPTATGKLAAGMFARGEFRLGHSPALTLPQSAVLLRDGYAYIYRVESGNKVAMTKVGTGRRNGERIEIIGAAGMTPATQVVAGGVGFLADGDTVRIVPAATLPSPRQ